MSGRRKKYRWVCQLDPTHEWEATPDQMMSGKSCPTCAGTTLDETEVLSKAAECFKQKGSLRGSADPYFPGQQWPAIRMAWTKGYRGLAPHDKSIAATLGIATAQEKLPDGQILAGVQAYASAHGGRWPGPFNNQPARNLDAAEYLGVAGASWRTAEARIRRRHGLSWRRWLIRELAWPITEENIVKAAVAFNERQERPVKVGKGSTDTAPEFGQTQFGTPYTWTEVNKLHQSRGGVGVLEILRSVGINAPRSIRLTEGDVDAAILQSIARGYVPRSGKSPRVLEIRGVRFTWVAIDLSLRKGLNGLRGGDTLSARVSRLAPELRRGRDGRLCSPRRATWSRKLCDVEAALLSRGTIPRETEMSESAGPYGIPVTWGAIQAAAQLGKMDCGKTSLSKICRRLGLA